MVDDLVKKALDELLVNGDGLKVAVILLTGLSAADTVEAYLDRSVSSYF